MKLDFKQGKPPEYETNKWYVVRYVDGLIGSCLWKGKSWDNPNFNTAIIAYAEYSQPVERAFIHQFPHCDPKILHAPNECTYCDGHRDWQELRDVWNINFTGQHDPNKSTCPAEKARPLSTINKWSGNTPQPKED